MIDPVAFTISLGENIIVKDIYWYGIVMAAGMIIALLVALLNSKKLSKDPEALVDFIIIAVLFAVIGARVHRILWSWDIYKDQPFWKMFAVWEGGLDVFGGVIAGILVAFVYSRIKKTSMLSLLDIVVPSLMFGQAIAKWGSFFNQTEYGYPIFDEKYWHFPITVFIQETGLYHLATFFYESMWNFLGFIILMISLRKAKREGKTFFLYLVLYGIGRIIVEGLMMDSQMFLDTSIRVNQVYSAVFIILGGALYLFNRHAKDYALFSNKGDTRAKKNKPGRIQVKKIADQTANIEKDTVNEYTAMTDEMRRQREQSLKNKE